MRILIIGNPIASGGNALNRMDRLENILKHRGHSVMTYMTKYAGDGKENIGRISQGIDRIVIVGGDGTVNEIVNGLPKGFSIPLCQWPTGNANLLKKELCLPDKPLYIADLVENGRVIMADLAVMNGEKFIMLAGTGFDARVTEELKKVRTKKVNNFSYILPILRALRAHSQSRVTVCVDDQEPVTGAVALVCNVKNYAGICEIAFDAGLETGCLDIVVFPKDTFFSLAKYLILSMVRKTNRLKGVSYLKGSHIRIRSDILIPVELDGDFNGRHREVVIELIKGVVPIIS